MSPRLGWCLAGQHAECWGTVTHSQGVQKTTECACDGAGHTTPHLKADPDDEKVVKRGGHF